MSIASIQPGFFTPGTSDLRYHMVPHANCVPQCGGLCATVEGQDDDGDDDNDDDDHGAPEEQSPEEASRFTEGDMAVLKLLHGVSGAEGTSASALKSIFDFIESKPVSVDGLTFRSPEDIQRLKAKIVASDGWVTVPASESDDPASLKEDPDFVIGYLPLKRATCKLLSRHERRRRAGTAAPVAWEAKPVLDDAPGGAGKHRVFWEPEAGPSPLGGTRGGRAPGVRTRRVPLAADHLQ